MSSSLCVCVFSPSSPTARVSNRRRRLTHPAPVDHLFGLSLPPLSTAIASPKERERETWCSFSCWRARTRPPIVNVDLVKKRARAPLDGLVLLLLARGSNSNQTKTKRETLGKKEPSRSQPDTHKKNNAVSHAHIRNAARRSSKYG